MRKTLLTASALAAFVIAAPAVAQDATAPAPMPAPVSPAPELNQSQAGEVPVVKPKFLGQQLETELLASVLIGATVCSPADEGLGDINDIVMAEEGRVEAVIVGVGGFLGIGEKNVAISFDAITETTDTDGNVRLVLDTTREEIDAAPVYMTVADLKRQQEIDAMQAVDPNLAPAPVPTN